VRAATTLARRCLFAAVTTAVAFAPARRVSMGPKRSRHFGGGSSADAAAAAAPTATKKAKARRASSVVAVEPPSGWRRAWDMCVELRADRTAVVDSMGCGELTNPGDSAADRAYQTLVSLMLSSQTRDTANAATMRVLLRKGLSVDAVLATDPADFEATLKAGHIGMYAQKTAYVYETTRAIKDVHGGAVPETLAELVALKGVGPKMALLQLQHACGKIEGISVDTHVHRICNQLGWTGGDTGKNAEKTRRAIESWVPRDLWPHVNVVFVGLGQEVQTEKAKLLRKALRSSDAPFALDLLNTLGVDAAAVAAREGIDLPEA